VSDNLGGVISLNLPDIISHGSVPAARKLQMGGRRSTTDIYAHYKLAPNLHLIVGNRNYSDGPNKMFYGIGASTALAPRIDGYASVTTSSIATDWQVGATYKLNSQTALHLGYKFYKEDGASS
jgi:hypothetical protein